MVSRKGSDPLARGRWIERANVGTYARWKAARRKAEREGRFSPDAIVRGKANGTVPSHWNGQGFVGEFEDNGGK